VYVPGGRDIVCDEKLGEQELRVCDSMCASGWSFREGDTVLYRYTTQRVHLNEIILIDGD
jgi:hypothetical protein